MILSADEYERTQYLQELSLTRGETLVEALSPMSDNTIGDTAVEYARSRDIFAPQQEGGRWLPAPLNFMREQARMLFPPLPGKKLNREEAQGILKEKGVSDIQIPEEGLTTGALDYLIENKQNRDLREERLSRSQYWGVNFAGSLVSGLTDPAELALGFVPVIRSAKYAELLGEASGILGRTAVRAGVGAAEGAAGALVAEPLRYHLQSEMYKDYGAMESMTNIAFGMAMGSFAHATFGAWIGPEPKKAGDSSPAIPSELPPSAPEITRRLDELQRHVDLVASDSGVIREDSLPGLSKSKTEFSGLKLGMSEVQQAMDIGLPAKIAVAGKEIIPAKIEYVGKRGYVVTDVYGAEHAVSHEAFNSGSVDFTTDRVDAPPQRVNLSSIENVETRTTEALDSKKQVTIDIEGKAREVDSVVDGVVLLKDGETYTLQELFDKNPESRFAVFEDRNAKYPVEEVGVLQRGESFSQEPLPMEISDSFAPEGQGISFAGESPQPGVPKELMYEPGASLMDTRALDEVNKVLAEAKEPAFVPAEKPGELSSASKKVKEEVAALQQDVKLDAKRLGIEDDSPLFDGANDAAEGVKKSVEMDKVLESVGRCLEVGAV